MNYLMFNAICWLSVGVSAAIGLSENAGLFGAIIGGGMFILCTQKDKP